MPKYPTPRDLRSELKLRDEDLIELYRRDWEKFERECWWPWYEQYGARFFAMPSEPEEKAA